MKWKRLGSSDKLSEEVLRQRRGVFTISLALLAYAIADGSVASSGSFASLPITMKNPGVIIWFAWFMWAYFLYRFWLVTDAVFAAFATGAKLHALTFSPLYRDSVASVEAEAKRDDAHWKRIEPWISGGWMPEPRLEKGKLIYATKRVWLPRSQSTFAPVALELDCESVGRLPLLLYGLAWLVGGMKAAFLETEFTNLILPYLVAGAALFVSLWRVAG